MLAKKLIHIAKISSSQISFGKKLGLDLHSFSITLAMAKIEDMIDRGFRGSRDLGGPSTKQIEFATKFGHDIHDVSRREANAIIYDLMTELNLETIESEALAPNVTVRNIHDVDDQRYVISSISPDGTVYFRGGNGKRAWARSLRRIIDA